jgi:radical SAM superfamily enzyme YgiQ (UPF0313 family)
MKIELVSPYWQKNDIEDRKRAKVFKVPPLGLLNVAAVTPKDIDITLTDENVEPVLYDKDPDLVGITVTTAGASRAYEIADNFAERDIPVVVGGPHVTFMVEEALQHADSVVVGECEGNWERLIEDFRNGGKDKLHPVYKSEQKPDLSKVPLPRMDIVDKSKYITPRVIHITRGCPYNCSFCSVSEMFGRKIRYRPVDQVVKFVKEHSGNSLNERLFVFLDDNIMAHKGYASKLFEALIPHKILWISQASINSAYHEDLVELAGKSGCVGLFAGLETISSKALQEIGKSQNQIEFYKTAINRFHKHGIFVEGAFIFGFDSDNKDVFEKTVKFINNLQLDGVQYSVLTPLPGTRFYHQIKEEDRFINHHWGDYDCAHVVCQPKGMSVEELRAGLHWAYKKTYGLVSILRRTAGVFKNWKRIKYFPFVLIFNMGYRYTCAPMFSNAWNPHRKPSLLMEILPILQFLSKLKRMPRLKKIKQLEALSKLEEFGNMDVNQFLEKIYRLNIWGRIMALRRLRMKDIKTINRLRIRYQEIFE